MKKACFILLLLLLVGGGAFWWLNRNLGSLLAGVVEEQGSALTGVPVEVGAFDLNLAKGRGEIRGMSLANPEGFTDPHAFSLDRITMDIDLSSLSGEPKRLSGFVIQSPGVWMEVADDNRTNLLVLADRIRRTLPEKEPGPVDDPEKKPAPADTRIAIDRLRIAGVRLTVRHRKLGAEPKSLTLPDITLTDVGGTGGVTGGRLAAIVLEEIAKEGLKEALKEEAARRATDLLRKAFD